MGFQRQGQTGRRTKREKPDPHRCKGSPTRRFSFAGWHGAPTQVGESQGVPASCGRCVRKGTEDNLSHLGAPIRSPEYYYIPESSLSWDTSQSGTEPIIPRPSISPLLPGWIELLRTSRGALITTSLYYSGQVKVYQVPNRFSSILLGTEDWCALPSKREACYFEMR